MSEGIEYDKIIHSELEDITIIDYGILYGNNKILFIKVGYDGDMYGYENKYLKMAIKINEKYGYTVIVSSNPIPADQKNPLDNALNVINDYAYEKNFPNFEILYFGYSNGALIGAQYGYLYSEIKKMTLVNAPLMYNWHKTKKGIQNFAGEKIVLVYGSLDQSFKYTGLITPLTNDKIKLEIINGQDHLFSKDTFEFENLPEKFLLNS